MGQQGQIAQRGHLGQTEQIEYIWQAKQIGQTERIEQIWWT